MVEIHVHRRHRDLPCVMASGKCMGSLAWGWTMCVRIQSLVSFFLSIARSTSSFYLTRLTGARRNPPHVSAAGFLIKFQPRTPPPYKTTDGQCRRRTILAKIFETAILNAGGLGCLRNSPLRPVQMTRTTQLRISTDTPLGA